MGDIEKVKLTKTKLIAHRGLSHIAPENTKEAFIKAGEAGFYGIECDVHVTKDNKFVVFHDFTLERMASKKSFVNDLTLNELKQHTLISGSNIQEYQNVKIPSLEEYLDICTKFQCIPVIEVKEVNDFKDLDQLIIVLKQYQLFDKAIVISFQLNYLIYLKKKYPNLQIQFLVEEITSEVISICDNYHFNIDTSSLKVTKAQIEFCHKNNILVNAYTVDDKEVAEDLSGYGIDFITTNRLVNEN